MRFAIHWAFFLFGFSIGSFWCLVWIQVLANGRSVLFFLKRQMSPSFSYPSRKLLEGTGRNRDGPSEWPEEEMKLGNFKFNSFTHIDYSIANNLTQDIRVLCLVTTTKRYHQTRAIHVKQTWGQKCNKLIFLSDADDSFLGAEVVSNSTDYSSVWGKVKHGFLLAFRLYEKKFEWFLKTDDDTYVIMENFRHYVSRFSSDEALFVGHRLHSVTPVGFNSGGAGYALSRKALHSLYSHLRSTPPDSICNALSDEGIEDVEIGKCLHAAGVKIVNSRDSEGNERFHHLTPTIHLSNDSQYTQLLLPFDFYSSKNFTCCGDYAVTFHYISPTEMYTLDYLIYRLWPFGVRKTFTL